MSKRQIDQNDKQAKQFQTETNIDKVATQPEDDMGEFEDPFEDEMESEEEVIDPDQQDEVTEVNDEEEEEENNLEVYLPGGKLEEGEKLEVDNSAYVMLHSLNVPWPCLSFDIIEDHLGNDRTKFPLTSYLVTGTQADKANKNEVMVLKLSQLSKTKYDDDDEDMSDDDEIEDDPILESRSIPHFGGVNRIRSTKIDNNIVAATWSDTGKVHIYDLQPHLAALDVPGHTIPPRAQQPIYTIESHGQEGFAMDWSTIQPGKLITGDFNNRIYLSNVSSNGISPDRVPFTGHQGSIEDLQWSPSEANVFSSCSSDCSVKIWDIRNKKRPALGITAHSADVNVITWNKKVNYLLASGSDDGSFSVWDLRTFSNSKTPTPVATFKWHSAPITSIEWHPTEESIIGVSGADDQVSLWDLSVEPDEEDPSHATFKQANGSDVPPQLLFVHQGQNDIKEIHWHKQIPGCMVSTSYSGFNIFKTISI
ncbi:WD40 repeat-like protein [Neoconidiobolus thromboides FSU 785]|nr:WD40 repeat-like protein [Neoconidiobolus thromboides FSU 785]